MAILSQYVIDPPADAGRRLSAAGDRHATASGLEREDAGEVPTDA